MLLIDYPAVGLNPVTIDLNICDGCVENVRLIHFRNLSVMVDAALLKNVSINYPFNMKDAIRKVHLMRQTFVKT